MGTAMVIQRAGEPNAAEFAGDMAACHADQASCPAIWQQLGLCWELMQSFEPRTRRSFDWIITTRPDLKFLYPLGDIRGFSPDRIHVAFTRWATLADLYAVVPRRFADIYFQSWL